MGVCIYCQWMSPIWILKRAAFPAERLVTSFLLFASFPLFKSGMAEDSEQKFCFIYPFLLCESTQLRLREGMVLAVSPGWTNSAGLFLQRNSSLQQRLFLLRGWLHLWDRQAEKRSALETGCESCCLVMGSASVSLVAEPCCWLFKASVKGRIIPQLISGGPLLFL